MPEHATIPPIGNKVPIVGIGASAGGLEAIIKLIGRLEPNFPCAYVILQHLSPKFPSHIAEVLGRETLLTVKEAEADSPLEAGTIYVVPANANAILKDGKLLLITPDIGVMPSPSINRFFFSLAEEENAIGIVLSGTGSDGTAGLRAIRAAGGITIAQKPDTAKYGDMPQSAITAGVVNYVLTPTEIPQRLYQLLTMLMSSADEVFEENDLFERVLIKLKEALQLDFSGYKFGTLMRRIKRRQIATGKPDLAAYLKCIEGDTSELNKLARDILISVTAFFRDRAAFDSLKQSVEKLCDQKPSGSEIRVWVAGCASGEEAYSIAIVFAEVLATRLTQYRLQIFATDIDEDALATARRGVYSAAALTEMPPEWLARYFSPADKTSYEVGKALRDLIVFARHNLVNDPPFHRVDLISCRNVLIYFDAGLQAKILPSFHFALNKEGYLFLGKFESTHTDSLFVSVDWNERVFRKSGEVSVALAATIRDKASKILLPQRDHRAHFLLAGLIEHFRLTVVLCDFSGVIRHTAGQVERFLHFPVGVTNLTINDAIIPPLRSEVLTLLHQFQRSGKTEHGRKRKVGKDSIRLFIIPISEAAEQRVMILFVPEKNVDSEEKKPKSASAWSLEDELAATREHLQTLVEEMATANEEMQALNEEAQAANEELEAANEELQASNEELLSLNEELSFKTQEVFTLSEEYAHLYDALDFPILVFDCALQLLRLNKAAKERLNLHITALHQPISALNLAEPLKKLEEVLARVVQSSAPASYRFVLSDRDWQLTVNPGLDPGGGLRNLIVTLVDLTAITRAQVQLQESQAQLSALMENTAIKFAMKDLRGHYLYANPQFLNYFGIYPEDYIGKNDFALLPSEIAASFWSDNVETMRRREKILKNYSFDIAGSQRHLRIVNQLIHDAAGQPTAFLVEAEDITGEKKAEQQLELTAKVFDQAGEAIVVTNGRGLIQTVNAAFTEITGYPQNESIGQSISQLLRTNRHPPEFYMALSEALKNNGFWQGEIWNRRKNGEIFPEWLTVNRIDSNDGQIEHYVSIFSDISGLKESQEKAEYLATHDPLTELPNRALFMDRLRQALSVARRHKSRIALLFIDLDNFKSINDALGHNIGDELLQMAADRLRKAVREVDTIARLGGDEFTAILVECDENISEHISGRIVDDLSSSYLIDGRTLFISASVGIAFYPEDSQDSIGLVKAADTAMYRAKEEGRNRIEFFKPDLHTKLFKTRALENGLREALLHDRFYLVYQPKFALTKPYVIKGAEVMLRWNDPELGDITPLEFIPVAENSGLIMDITDKTIDILLTQIEVWEKQGLKVPGIAVNISPKCIREINFSSQLIERMRKKSVIFTQLQVEITEGALLENSNIVKANLLALSKVGIKIAIDDFGTGYSSLSYLKRLPLSELKIDKSFVDGLGHEAEDEAIAKAVLNLSKALGLQTVAEGVETREQLIWLSEHGCDQAQGFLLSRPLTTEGFTALISQSPS